jgi:hypothetical protein
VVLTFVVNLTIAVQVGLFDHIVDLLLRQPLPQAGHHVAQFVRRYQAVVVLVEDPEKNFA